MILTVQVHQHCVNLSKALGPQAKPWFTPSCSYVGYRLYLNPK